MMKNRQNALMITAALAVIGYFAKVSTEDTMPKAADRMAKAILSSDTDTLWDLMPQDEREYYGFDKEGFAQYWTKIVQPSIKDADAYEFRSESSNGILVSVRSSKKGEFAPRFSLLVSGQLGKYYAPYMVARSSFDAAGMKFKSFRVEKHLRAQNALDWLTSNKNTLQSVGVTKMRRGPELPSQTLDQMIAQFKTTVVELKKEVQVASR